MPDKRPYQDIFYELKEAVLRGSNPVTMDQLEDGITGIRASMMGILAALERLKGEKLDTDAWDRWYKTIPHDIREKIDLHDFTRLGECFKQAFRVED